MTNPYGPNNNGEGNDSNSGFNPYPPSQHPEDRPNFGQPQSGSTGNNSLPSYGDYSQQGNSQPDAGAGNPNPQGYGAYPTGGQQPGPYGDPAGYGNQQGYGNAYGYGQGGNDYNATNQAVPVGGVHPNTGWRLHQGEATGVPIGAAISYGFKETFKNAKIWILGAFLFFLISMALSGIEGALTGTSLLSTIASLVIAIGGYRLAFNALDGRALNFGDAFKGYDFWRALLVCILCGFIWAVVMIPGIVMMVSGFIEFLQVAENAPANADPDYLFSLINWGALIGGFFLMLILATVAAPFVTISQLFPIDKNTSVGQSFSEGFKVGKKHYLGIFGFLLVAGLLATFVMLITLFIGMIIVLPVMINSTSYVFRTVTGGVRPVDRM